MYIIYIYNYNDKKNLVVRGVLIVSLIFFGLCNYYSEQSFGIFQRFSFGLFRLFLGYVTLYGLSLWFVQFQKLSLNLVISRII